MFYTSQLNLLGHVVTDKGLRPHLKKVEAILRMPDPTDVEAVRLSTITEPIRRLTRQDCNWEWGEEQETAMSQLKRLVTTAPLLAYYDPAKKLTIQCDASSTGLGAALVQEGKPLAYASRALSDTEVGYAQIEKECLAIVFSLERFHQYTFGRETAVHTDHKPLETIVKKALHKAPKRIQGMLLRLLQYGIDVTYRRGKEMHFADALSRAYLSDGNDRQGQFSQINAIKHLPIGQSTLQKLRVATDAGNTTSVLNGWPGTKADVNAEISSYFAMRDELAIHDRLIFKGERVVVPQGMRKEIKHRLHQSHMGADSMVRRARVCIF